MSERFRVYCAEHDGHAFIIDGQNPTSSEYWLGVGMRTAATAERRKKYAEEICRLLNGHEAEK